MIILLKEEKTSCQEQIRVHTYNPAFKYYLNNL